jgi:putative transposase
MQREKRKSSRILLREYNHLNKACWGRHLWVRELFVASFGNVTDEVIMEFLRTQEVTKEDDDFRVDEG